MAIDRNSSSPEERQAFLLERINAAGRVLASAAAVELGVSEDSIRRDLKCLSDAGLVQKFHGGAMRLASPAADFRYREHVGIEEKLSIGRAAAATIEEGASLFLDSSTTVLQFLRCLRPALNVRIITTAVDVAAAALDHPIAEVTLIGGRLNRLTRSSTGAVALDALRYVRPDICVLGTCGIDADLNIRADDIEDAHLKSAMIASAVKTIMLAPRDKIGRHAAYQVAPVSAINTLFTSNFESRLVNRIQDLGIDVVTPAAAPSGARD